MTRNDVNQEVFQDAGQPEYGPVSPIEVRWPLMMHRWDLLTFLHWSYPPEVVQALLPDGLTVETFDDGTGDGPRAWVGLVPFMMEVRPPKGPAIPGISHFCETNVRTYVTAPDGTRGVWFLSLDAAALPPVVAARQGFRLPYYWSKMTFERNGDEVEYRCQRRWPDGDRLGRKVAVPNARSTVRMRIGDPIAPDEVTSFEHYLSARWRLYSSYPSGLRYALAWHEPWPLHRAEVLELDDQLVAASGLPQPEGDPVCHWSPGVEVRIGVLRKLQA